MSHHAYCITRIAPRSVCDCGYKSEATPNPALEVKTMEEIHAFDKPRCDVHGTALEQVSLWMRVPGHERERIVSWRCVICDLEATSEGDAGGSESRDSYGHEHATERRVPPALAEDCEHLSMTGVDQVDLADPAKVWRCDSCGWEGVRAERRS